MTLRIDQGCWPSVGFRARPGAKTWAAPGLGDVVVDRVIVKIDKTRPASPRLQPWGCQP